LKGLWLGPDWLDARLGHWVGTKDYVENPRPGVRAEWKEDWRLSPVRLSRPTEGVSSVELRCGACRKRIKVNVASARSVRARRILFVLLAIVLGTYAGLGYLVTRGEAEGFLALVGLSSFVAGIVSLVLLFKTFTSEFARAVAAVPQDKTAMEGHKVFQAGESLDKSTLGTP